MSRSVLLLAVPVLVLACAQTPRSAWEKAGVYHVCRCEGSTRAPTPSEAASYAEDEYVDLYCEGKVSNCHVGRREPLPRRGGQLD